MRSVRNNGISARHLRVTFRNVLTVFTASSLMLVSPGLFQSPAFAAAPAPPFTQCPAVGYNTRCTLLIDVTSTGLLILRDNGATLSTDPVPGTYDGVEDTLIGVVNNSGAPLSTLTLSSNSQPIFGFDNDGICQDPNNTSTKFGLHCNGTVHSGNNYFNPHDSTGYGGNNAFFTNISSDFRTGIVHFFTAIPSGGSDFFSLEEKLDIPDFCQDTITLTPGSVTSVVGGAPQTFTATILDLGTPAAGIAVTFSVSAGPHAGASGVGNTDANGQVQFTVPSSSVAGTDIVQAGYHDPTCTNPPTHSAVPSTLTWTKASPSITTQAGPTAITVGTATSVGDTATFQNTVSVAPTGSVAFTLYSNNTCTTSTGISGSGAISTTAGVSTASFSAPWTAPATGTYYWRVSYAGDTGNNAFTSVCGAANEVVAVNPGSPSITTQANPTSIIVGTATSVGDTATFQNTTSVASTGSVTFTLYTNNTCTTSTGISGSGPISTAAGVSTASFSSSWTAPATGTYYWRASYPGDTNNNAIATACGAAAEVIAVGPASPTLTTQATPGSITVGTATMTGDTATFQNTTAVAPTGAVAFELFSDSACATSTGVSGAGAISTTLGVSAASFSTGWIAPATGPHYWRASYPGDSNNNAFTAACGAANELLVVAPGSPVIVTQALPTTVNVGAATVVSDSATFKETTTVPPTGSVGFTLYSNNTCTTPTGVSGSGVISTTAGVSAASFSVLWTAPAIGTYYWRATYAGDANNDGFTTGCGDTNETIMVNVAPTAGNATRLTTLLAGGGVSGGEISVPAGTPVTDSATITGSSMGLAGGTITYAVYADASCRDFVASAGTKNVIPGDVPSSDPITLNSTGHFFWRATYSGDARNGSSASNCGDEVENVLPLDHFLCYVAQSTPASGLGFVAPANVQLRNSFSPNGFAPGIGSANLDCNPVQKTVPNGVSKITNPNAHLVCFGISAPATKKTVIVSNQFGRAKLKISSVTQVCLPSWQSLSGPPNNASTAPPGLGHFTCYSASYVRGTTPFKPPTRVLVKDEFSDRPVRVKIGAPQVLCLPTTKVANAVTYPAVNPEAHLLCFAVNQTPRKSSVYDENQFGTSKLRVAKTKFLCLPSTKIVVSR